MNPLKPIKNTTIYLLDFTENYYTFRHFKIKTMKKIYLGIIALTLFLNACSSSDDSSETTNDVLLSKIVETYDDGFVSTLLLTYNGNKIVKADWDGEEVTEFTYTGNLITQEEYFFEGDLEDVITYQYDANERLIRSTRVETNGFTEVDEYTHNANGTVSFVTERDGELIAEGTFYFSNNRPYKKEITTYFEGFESDEVIEVTFDDKNEPFKNVTGYNKLSIALPNYMSEIEDPSNNVLTVKRNAVTILSTTYTYNSNNYPATSITTGESLDDNYSSVYYY